MKEGNKAILEKRTFETCKKALDKLARLCYNRLVRKSRNLQRTLKIEYV